jgi:2'-5' RNA ligase
MNDKSLRLFFAIPCPVAQAEAICRWRDSQQLPGRPVPPANLHLTLAFLGAQPPEALEPLQRLAGALRCAPFELCLDRLDSIGQGFICLTPQHTPVELEQLAARLKQALLEQGLVSPDSRPFLPHLTLSRQSPVPACAVAPRFTWPVARFGLYASESAPNGVHYRELASWPLTE